MAAAMAQRQAEDGATGVRIEDRRARHAKERQDDQTARAGWCLRGLGDQALEVPADDIA